MPMLLAPLRKPLLFPYSTDVPICHYICKHDPGSQTPLQKQSPVQGEINKTKQQEKRDLFFQQQKSKRQQNASWQGN